MTIVAVNVVTQWAGLRYGNNECMGARDSYLFTSFINNIIGSVYFIMMSITMKYKITYAVVEDFTHTVSRKTILKLKSNSVYWGILFKCKHENSWLIKYIYFKDRMF